MKLIKVGAAVLNQTPLSWQQNQRNIAAAIAAARADGVSILCMPEMCITGYGCEDVFLSPGLHRSAAQMLCELAPLTEGMVVSLGLPLYHEKAVYNAACLLIDGAVAGFVCKRFLAGDGVHYEPRWFKPWPAGMQGTIDFNGAEVPIGDLYFNVGGIGIGFEICEDAWVANRPGAELALRGVDVILNPSASHFAFDKVDIRKRFCIEGSRAFGVVYVYANLLGNEAGRIIYDGSALIASEGRLAAVGPRCSYADFLLTSAVVDIEANRIEQSRRGSHTPHHQATERVRVRKDFDYPELAPQRVELAPLASWETSPHRAEEEFARAVALALFDYLRKSRTQGFVVSLSGGADSTATAALVALAIELAVAELGVEGVKKRLSHVRGIEGDGDARSIVHRVLTCAYQGTRNSSDTTRNAAAVVAKALGAEYHELEVDAQVDGYVKMIERAIGRELTWEHDDVTLQNIQARVRSPSIWMLANLRGALLLSTSNRSEAAVGYATMDGDTSGGVCPVGGIDKAFLRRWLRWLEREGPSGHHPVPALAAVTAQQPTAELRPRESEQTDEGDLMPYELLDAIENAAIGAKHTPLEVYREMRAFFPQYEPRQLGVWIERFFVLWCRNQWKRERYAPSFHVDDKNLDPKTWCRFPILSGGFDRELAELRAHVAKEA